MADIGSNPADDNRIHTGNIIFGLTKVKGKVICLKKEFQIFKDKSTIVQNVQNKFYARQNYNNQKLEGL